MRSSLASRLPALRGGLLALLAAVLFGASTQWGQGLGPFTTAALLYAGAALVGGLLKQPVDKEARLRRSDLRCVFTEQGQGHCPSGRWQSAPCISPG